MLAAIRSYGTATRGGGVVDRDTQRLLTRNATELRTDVLRATLAGRAGGT